MKKDPVKVIPLEQLQLNEGQIDWLPRNPRTWTQTDIDRTKRSLYTWTKKHHNYRISPYRTSVWDIEKPRQNDQHPTMKPIALVEAAMLDGSKEGDVVIDFFGGSGTTLVTAEQLGRKCYMMEIDPHYCDVILARWEKLTGKTANKLN